MTNLSDISTAELRRIVAIREQIETLQGQIDSIVGNGIPTSVVAEKPKKRRMSAAGRAKIAAAARARWAKVKATKTASAPMKRRKMSAAAKTKLAAAARARWAKAKAQGKKSL